MEATKPESDKKYSYADYQNWPDDQRWELIEGVPYDMSPAPLFRHQQILMAIGAMLFNFLKGKPCKVSSAPTDVRFKNQIHAADKETFTVVQPDLIVVCDKDKIDKKGIVGAPDICIEILSESTAYKDESEKYTLYEKNGVKEYWIVNPELSTIQVFVHNGNEFQKPFYYRKDETLTSSVLEGLELSLADIFEE